MDILTEMKDLMSRMENYGSTGFLNEVTCKWRSVVGEESFFDLLSSLKAGDRMTFGYVTPAKIEVPKGKRLNPKTNRMNQFDDYEQLGKELGEEGTVVSVIKLSIYNISWQRQGSGREDGTDHYDKTKGWKDQSDIDAKYSAWKAKRNEIGSKYGVEFGKANYGIGKADYGTNGISTYSGANTELNSHTYTNLNMYNIKPISTQYYLVMSDGKLRPVDVSKLKLIAYKSDSVIDKLRAAGATDEDIEGIVGMDYRRFEHSKVLFISATPEDGIPTLLINNKLSNKLGGITDVDTSEIIKLAQDRYSKFTSNKVSFDKTKIHLFVGVDSFFID